ncbi:unnamed protein product [Staurois parvus]|uniref:Uncharacterized protein n=1 Tax=Staurois parvus TaxID=386267 RepID=A0ABN9CC62_9NEOB|nr:unnamed protein product [Staurois parvus]
MKAVFCNQGTPSNVFLHSNSICLYVIGILPSDHQCKVYSSQGPPM